MIKVESLSVHYGLFKAVDDISFNIEEGEICGFLGPNGAGKTSTIRAITGFIKPKSGKVLVDGVSLQDDELAVKEKIGYMPESPPLYSDLRVKEMLRLGAVMRKVKDPESSVEKAMELTGISDRKDQLIGTLSKGYRQRVGISLAMVGDPKVLIFDEPMIGLDPMQALDIKSLLKSLTPDHTIIFSSHILYDVQAICSKILIISGGRLLAVDKTKNLTDSIDPAIAELVVKIKSSQDDHLEKISSLESVKEAQLEDDLTILIKTDDKDLVRKQIVKLVYDNDWDLLEIRSDSRSLEDVYKRVILAGGDFRHANFDNMKASRI